MYYITWTTVLWNHKMAIVSEVIVDKNAVFPHSHNFKIFLRSLSITGILFSMYTIFFKKSQSIASEYGN